MIDIVCADSLRWLRDRHFGAIVTSLPDAAETKQEIPEWEAWFCQAAKLVAECADQVVFFQTDRKTKGEWIGKRDLLTRTLGRPRWAKIVLRSNEGVIDLFRPGYSHLIAFGGSGPGAATADVIGPSRSEYSNGVPSRAAQVAVDWLTTGPACDPFCGLGGFFPALKARGFHITGVDISKDVCDILIRRYSQMGF